MIARIVERFLRGTVDRSYFAVQIREEDHVAGGLEEIAIQRVART
ncbi:MAG TPA: hypothetical protein VIL92_14540 [Gaiellaceae bacterium]